MCHCLVMQLRVGLRFFESVLGNTHIFGDILFSAFKNVEPSKTFLQALFVISCFNNLLNFLLWWRYPDDVFMIWSHGEEKVNEFVNLLNFSHETIKFTHEVSPSKINFLDVTVLPHYNKIATDLHVKSTDTHQYFLSSSCHPNNIKKSISYSLIALRIHRICSTDDNFKQRTHEFLEFLCQWGHKRDYVKAQINKAFNVLCKDTLYYIQFCKSVAWLAMMNLQEPFYDRLTPSAQP